MGLCGDSCVRRGKLLGREPSNREGVGTGRILADREGLWGGGQFSCRAMGKGQSLGKGAGFGKKSVADGGMASQVFLHPPLQSLRTTARSCAGYTPLPRRTLRPSASRAAPTYPHPHTPTTLHPAPYPLCVTATPMHSAASCGRRWTRLLRSSLCWRSAASVRASIALPCPRPRVSLTRTCPWTFPVHNQPKLCVSDPKLCSSPNAYPHPFVFFLYYFVF